MMNRWLKGVAIAALTAVGAVAAQAADLPTRKEAPAPVFVPPPFTWTGFYVGLNAGGIWPSGSRSASLFAPAAFAFRRLHLLPGRSRIAERRLPRRRSGWLQLADGRLRARRRNRLRRLDPQQVVQQRRHSLRRRGVPAILAGDYLERQRQDEPELARHHARAALASSPRRTIA